MRCALAVLLFACSGWAQVRRIVIIKSDGLPGELLREYADRKELPWIGKIFFRGGVEVANFYTRGISVSAPSWSVLETGRDSIVRGNVEFDRYTLHAYDYLNFFPFYFRYARSRQVDTTPVEVLDSVGARRIADFYSPDERYQGFQLYQRGVRWNSLMDSLKRGVNPRSLKNLIDEWFVGFAMEDSVNLQVEQELIENLQNPRVRYLDLYHTEFDHVAHLTHDTRVLKDVLLRLDALVGRIWTAIENSPLRDETVLAMVSDHGINNDPAVYGQGWNLVDALRSAAGGAHHVITNRHPREDFKIRGLNPFVGEVVNESSQSFYLKGLAESYPTALVDLDGNERGSVYLRNSDWNALQILLQQLQRRDLPEVLRSAGLRAACGIVDRIGARDSDESDRLLPLLAAALSRKNGRDEDSRRRVARLQGMEEQLQAYGEYRRATAAKALLGIVPKRAMGEVNSVHQLQNYVVGPAPGGLALDAAGDLDWERSFRRVNYFAYFTGISVRNVPQAAVGRRPVDFVAARVPRQALAESLPPELAPDSDGVWVYEDDANQALILRRGGLLRYLPVSGLRESDRGELRFTVETARDGLPLAVFEETGAEWLSDWHSERDWLRATYRSAYSNAVVSLSVQFSVPARIEAPSEEERAFREFGQRERRAVEADLLVLANDHWNFNVRSVNPGGNHGGFFPTSTHATLVFAGGAKTGIPRGKRINEPYDGLSFAPTILKLAGVPEYASLPGQAIDWRY